MSLLWIIFALLPILGGAERFSCRGRILGAYYADAKSGCKAFHVCVRVAGGGIRDFRFFCPPGTLFHQEAQTCTDWGDDDPLACPADLYDGQFDLYKIGSGFDTKKLSSPKNRDEEPEFGLQRAETGDRRLNQNQGASNNAASDLKAAHSSDFFSGQRERGRDDSVPAPTAAPNPPPSPHQRQSFRRPTTRVTPPATSTQYTTAPQPPPFKRTQDGTSKRKLVRKRPVYYSSTLAPTTLAQSSPSSVPRQYQEQNQQNFARPTPEQLRQNGPQSQPRQYQEQNQQNFARPTSEQPRQNVPQSQPANVPPQFKDEYVEVSRVTPKSRGFPSSPAPTPFTQSTPAQRFSKKDGLSELFNYDSQSTPAYKQPSDRPFKVRNSFNVAPLEIAQVQDINRKNVNVSPNGIRATTPVADYSPSASTTSNYRNFNSVSYEPEKKNYERFSGAKQNYYSSPTTTPSTTAFTTARSDPPANLNTVAYNTNIGFNAQPINYSESDEDDGQYRLPPGEDDGQYRPEQYERELLTGAHSLNIAASGNRLPEDQKPRTKATPATAATPGPRPFRPAPIPSAAPSTTTRAPEPSYSTTFQPQTYNTQRTFDFVQTYTTTSRPVVDLERAPVSPNYKTTVREPSPTPSSSRIAEPRPFSNRAPAPPTIAPANRPTSRPPNFSKPASSKDDASYDYAYYDSDNGFSEYDHIEEFGRTKSRT